MSDGSNGRQARPSVRKLFATAAETAGVADAQSRIIDGLKSGINNLINRFFEDAREIVNIAILHATHDVYNDGTARGHAQAIVVFRAYMHVLDQKYADMVRDPRVEVCRPPVTADELRIAINQTGMSLSLAETEKLAADMRIDLARDLFDM